MADVPRQRDIQQTLSQEEIEEGGPRQTEDVPRKPDIGAARMESSIRRSLARLPVKPGDREDAVPCTIFLASSFVSATQPNYYYEPTILSVGPYHWNKQRLRAMGDNKTLFLRDLLSRAEDKSLNKCVEAIMRLESDARIRYMNTRTVSSLSNTKFAKMLLMDGCFIIELFYKCTMLQESGSMLSGRWSRSTMWTDLLKLENQIPFFVLEALFKLLLFPKLAKTSPTQSVDTESQQLLRILAGASLGSNITLFRFMRSQDRRSIPEVHHLLHLYYLHLTPRPQEERQSNTRSSKYRILRYTLATLARPSLFLRILADIIMLEECGVEFTKREEWSSLCDMTFNRFRGIMKIPQLNIDGETMTRFANLIAYEQLREGQTKYMLSFAFLMDRLINSPKDVALLREREIIVSDLGDVELADFFNNISRGFDLMTYPHGYCFDQLAHDVEEYCTFKLFRGRAHVKMLKRDYFSNPWALISFLAGAILLVLTIAQTVFTIYPYYHPRS